MIGPTPSPAQPGREAAQIVAVLLETRDGQLIRAKLHRPVTLRAGRTGEITVSIIGEVAYLTCRR